MLSIQPKQKQHQSYQVCIFLTLFHIITYQTSKEGKNNFPIYINYQLTSQQTAHQLHLKLSFTKTKQSQNRTTMPKRSKSEFFELFTSFTNIL